MKDQKQYGLGTGSDMGSINSPDETGDTYHNDNDDNCHGKRVTDLARTVLLANKNI